jgi:hypothetical protein
MARLEKKMGRADAALAILCDLACCRNPHRLTALEELAKHYEHRERNYGMALGFTLDALSHGETDSLVRRRERLQKRVAKHAANRRLL